MKKTVLTFGLIAGAILSLMMVLTFPFHDQVGFDRMMVVGYTSMVLAFLLVYFGVRSYRDNVSGGTVSFGRAFAVGGLIALVASACYVATWQVVYRTMTPDYLTKYQEYALDKARREGESESEIAAKKAEMEDFARMYANPLVNVAFTFVEPLPVALLMTLVSAGVLSRRKRTDTGVMAGAPSRAR